MVLKFCLRTAALALSLFSTPLYAQTVLPPDPTGSVTADGVYLPPKVADLDGAFEGAVDYVDDPRIGEWIALKEAGDLDGLITATEADLRSGAAHPYASQVWSWAQWASGHLTETQMPEIPDDLRDTLEFAARAFALDRTGRTGALALMAEEALARPEADYWAELDIAYANCTTGRKNQCRWIGWRLLERFPDDFGVAMLVGGNGDDDLDGTMAWLKSHPTVADEPGGRFVKWLVSSLDYKRTELLHVVEKWLDYAPNDPNALRRAAYQYEEFKRFHAALDAFEREEEVYPFRDAPTRIGRAQAALRQFKQAAETSRAWVDASVPQERRFGAGAAALVDMMRDAGEYGRAREIAIKALEEEPNNDALRVVFAKSLRVEGFPNEAVDVIEPVAAAKPAHYVAAGELVYALEDAKRHDEAIAAAKRYRAAGGLPHATIINQQRQALANLKRDDELDDLLREAQQELPETYWIQGNFAWNWAKAERYDEAFELIGDLVIKDPDSSWRINRLEEYGNKADRAGEMRDLFEALVERYPYSDAIWQKIAKMSGDAEATWQRAMEMAPGMAFPVVSLAKHYAEEDASDWQRILDMMTLEADRMQAFGAEDGQLAAVYLERASQVDDAIYKGYAPNSLVSEGLANMERARELGISEEDYWSFRYFLLGRAGASPERTEAGLRRAELKPDSLDAQAHLFQSEVARFLGTDATQLIFYHRFVSRKPRNSERLIGFAHRHNKWGGSPVVSLAALERAKRWDPEANVDVETGEAYSRLGAYQRHYETLYNRGKSVSDSQRYINWFDTARQNARKDQPLIKKLDLETMTVVKTRPDGIEEQQRFDPVTGRLLEFRVGGVHGEIDYTDDGYMTGIRVGKSKAFELEYSPKGESWEKRNVIRMTNGGEREFRFEYAPNDRPNMIEVVGLGRLKIEYDDQDEIAKVDTEIDDPDTSTVEVSMAVTEGFQTLLSLTKKVGEITNGDYSSFEVEDPELDAARVHVSELYEKAETDEEYLAYYDARLALAERLIAKVSDAAAYSRDAEDMLRETLYDVRYSYDEDGSESASLWPDYALRGIESVRLWRALMLQTRPDGLPQDEWELWQEFRDWVLDMDVSDPRVIGAQARFRAELAQSSLTELSDAGWLRKSPLTNPGFWRRHKKSDVFPKVLVDGGLTMGDVLVRGNGDVVVTSNKGFSVLRRGFWEWFGFDPIAGRFSESFDFAELDGASNITAIAEDTKGRLWLGTRAGLTMIPQDYDGEASYWRSGSSGLISGAVEALAANGSALAIGGDAGLAVADIETLEISSLSDEPIEALRPADDGWLVVGRNALWWQNGDNTVELVDAHVTDAMIAGYDETLFVLQGKSLKSAPWSALKQGAAQLASVEGQETIAATADPYGLAWLEVMRGESAITVLSDQGGSVMGRGGFEVFSQPNSDRPVGFRAADERDGRLFMVTSQGVAAVVRGEAHYALEGQRIYDLLTDADLGVTFIATGSSIYLADHKQGAADIERFYGANARLLRRSPDGALITHDGQTVLRFDPGSFTPRELFDTEQTIPDDGFQQAIAGILPASDGSIWAVAGASVFHWRDGEELQEFSMYKGDPDYPVKSDMLYRILETVDGRILLVASNEGHRTYNQKSLKGGLFEYDGDNFVKSDLDVLGRWFISSYTPIDGETAIAGTTGGFARIRGDKMSELDMSGDASYKALREVQPALYLGTRGAKLGEDLWLFGTAGGVVAMKGDTWFNTDRLNWMLPGQDYANYGARAVHAVETDPEGRVYVGTDWGLTVYDPDGAGANSFLISEQRGDFAFSAMEQSRMRAVNDILLDALPEDSDAGKLAANFRKSRKQLAKLEQELERARAESRPVADKLDKMAVRARQRDIAILAKLERDYPTLFNMLQLNPLDLQALGKRLTDDLVIVQYLPTKTTLYINLVTRDGAELKQVDVSEEDLARMTRLAAQAMAKQARSGQGEKARGFDLGGAKKDAPADAAPAAAAAVAEETDISKRPTTKALMWLYDRLLRPIENSVPDGATLVVSPAGSLSYLPFAALIRSVGPEGPEYAVQRFRLSSAPSLYAVDQMIDAAPSMAFSHVVFGDPDGTLPAARVEAENIADILSDDIVELRTGDDATYDELQTSADGARFVHLAMHGKLDYASPKDSYLLLADRWRMSIPQIMTLPLSDAELVFLSACESGLGTDGLEYRTIAHAFAHAGAPAVLATLWQVDDEATRTLAEGFYRAKMDGEDNATALRETQRAMIEAGGKHALPGYWASVVLFGKP